MTQRLIKTADPDLFAELPENLSIALDTSSTPSETEWFLHRQNQQLTLQGILDKQSFTLNFDLLSSQLNYRRQHGGGRKEPLAKAIGLKKAKTPFVIDTTAGMGREALLLAAMGCRVLAIERQPIIYLLLNDAVERLYQSANHDLSPKKLSVIQANSTDYLRHLANLNDGEKPQVIYLDPMFPERNKSAAVKKEMRIFKQLAGDDTDSAELLDTACKTATERVVVKRPSSAPFVNDRSPSFQITSKKHRFDVYLTQ